MQRFQTAFVFSIGCAAAFGCSSSEEPVNLGENPPAITGEALSDYAASWEGYVEGLAFEPGRVRLTLKADGTGTFIAGDDAPLPPVPTDPDLPPSFNNDSALAWFVMGGFPYSVQAANVENKRLRFGVGISEPYRPWCELQTSYPSEPGGEHYACVPNGPGGTAGDGVNCIIKPEGSEQVIVNCQKVELCQNWPVCTCDASGCGAPFGASVLDDLVRFDGTLVDEGAELVGTLVLDATRVTARFTRN